MNTKAVECDLYSNGNDERYIIIDTDTGEVLDDANGYGFKTAQGAHRCWGYKSKNNV